jgi:thiol-disulfide isomerase/thioredoxin
MLPLQKRTKFFISIFIAAVIAYFVIIAGPTAKSADRPPELALWDLNGQKHSLSEYRGKVVVLNFWATWCGPCQEELPMLVAERKRYRDRIVVIAASVDDATTVKKVHPFARKEKLNFPVWIGATVDHMQQFRLGDAVPSTAFLDSDGNVVGRVMGLLHQDDFEHRVDWLLGDSRGTAPPAVVNHLNPK